MSRFIESRRQLIMILTSVCIALTILSAYIAEYFNFPELRNLLIFIIFMYIISFVLAYKKVMTFSRVLFLLSFNIGLGYISSYTGKNGSVEFIYFFMIGLPFILFSNKREKQYVFGFLALPILMLILLYLTDFNLFVSKKVDPIDASSIVYPIAIASCILLLLFQLSYFGVVNSIHLKDINENSLEAIEASNAKSRFLGTMSHEIRTPLNAVIGLSHILADSKPREDQVENIEALNFSGKILLNLLNNVLDFSKMQTTEIQLDEIPTDLSVALKQIKKVHEESAKKNDVEIVLKIDKRIPVVLLDIVRYNQVLNNLVSNAVKFTKKGKIIITVARRKQNGKTLRIITKVRDTGIGISKRERKNIWEASSQANRATYEEYGGTGLGLPIVKKILDAMGSKVYLKSKVGKGTSIHFYLNLVKADQEKIQEISVKKEHNFEGKKVLLVEDNPINVMVGRQILEKAKLKVEVANNGLEAVNKVKENKYDVVLMDIQMPVMDGYTATISIREFDEKIPILALSASVFMEVKDKIYEAGMDGFIFKPFNPDDLLNQIDFAINMEDRLNVFN